MLLLPSLLHQQSRIWSCGLVYSFKKQISVTHSPLQFASSTAATEFLTQTTFTVTNWSLTKYTLIFIQLDQKVSQTQKVFKCGYDLTTAKQKWLLILIFGLRSLVDTRAKPEMDGIWNWSSKHWWKIMEFCFFPPEKTTKASASHHSNHWDITLEDMRCWLERWGTEMTDSSLLVLIFYFYFYFSSFLQTLGSVWLFFFSLVSNIIRITFLDKTTDSWEASWTNQFCYPRIIYEKV